MEGKKCSISSLHMIFEIPRTFFSKLTEIYSFQIGSSQTIDEVGGEMYMYLPIDKGNSDVSFGKERGNPEINFDSSIGANPNILINLSQEDAKTIDDRFFEKSRVKSQEITLTRNLSASICKSLRQPGNPINPVFALYNGEYWIHDPRFVSLYWKRK
jgi:hypothetical protein